MSRMSKNITKENFLLMSNTNRSKTLSILEQKQKFNKITELLELIEPVKQTNVIKIVFLLFKEDRKKVIEEHKEIEFTYTNNTNLYEQIADYVRSFCGEENVVNPDEKWFIHEKESKSFIPYFTNGYDEINSFRIRENSIVYISTIPSYIRGFHRLNSSYQGEKDRKLLNEKKDNYEGYIVVRGDGACYYRSVIVGILISILYMNDVSIKQRNIWMSNLIDKFDNIDISEFLSSLINEENVIPYLHFVILYTRYDKILITKSKILLVSFIDKHKNKSVSGMTIKNSIEAIFGSLEKYKSIILEPERDIEGIAAEMGLLEIMFGCSSYHIRKYNNEISEVKLESSILFNQPTLPRISIFFTGGHYDVMIPKISATKSSGGGASASLSSKGKINDRRKSTALASAKEYKTNIITNILFRSISSTEKIDRLENLLKNNSLNQDEINFINNSIRNLKLINKNQTKSSGGGALASAINKDPSNENILHKILSAKNVNTKIQALKEYKKLFKNRTDENNFVSDMITQLEEKSQDSSLPRRSKNLKTSRLGGSSLPIRSNNLKTSRSGGSSLPRRSNNLKTSRLGGSSSLPRRFSISQDSSLPRRSNNLKTSRLGGSSSLPKRFSISQDSSLPIRYNNLKNSRSGGGSSLPRRYNNSKTSRSGGGSSTKPRVSVVKFLEKKK